MEYIFEFIMELILEGSIEASSNKKVPKIIRYPLIAIVIIFFLTITLGLIVVGIALLKKNMLGGLFVIGVGAILLIAGIFKFRKVYLTKKEK